jgi:outer membrane protein OmpA-like peptidoglycan-associated protein
MFKTHLAAVTAVLLLAACQQQQPQSLSAPPPPPSTTQAAPQVFTVLFDTGRSTLSAQARGTIQQAASAYQSARGSGVTVTGHTDTTGSDQMNMALSQQRARAVTDGLVAAGVPATSINSTGTGEANLPVQTGDNVNEQRNRSVDITVSGAGAQQMYQMSDADYCHLLAQKWRDYTRTQPQGPAPAAIAQCEAGNYADGIPALQRVLTENRIPFPPRA